MRWRFAIGLCLAVVLWAGAGYSQPAPEEQPGPTFEGEPVAPVGEEERAPASEQDTAGEQDGRLDLLPAIEGIEAAIRDLIAPENQEERQRQQEREIADLQAQQDMAFWAELMFWAAIASVILTAVGVTLIAWTLHHTKRAADFAGTAATAAQEASKTAAEANTIFRSERRPWLHVEREIPCKFMGGSQQIGVEWKYTLRNFGQSPAIDVNVRSDLSIIRPFDLQGVAEAFYRDAWEKREELSGVVVYPGDDRGKVTQFRGARVEHPPADGEIWFFVAATYRFAHGGGYGMEAYAFGIDKAKKGAPLPHKLMGYTKLRRTL